MPAITLVIKESLSVCPLIIASDNYFSIVDIIRFLSIDKTKLLLLVFIVFLISYNLSNSLTFLGL